MTSVLLTDVVGGLAAVLLYGAVLWASYLAASRLIAHGVSTSARLAATSVIACWLLIAAFWLLVPFGLFRLPAALVLFAGLAATIHWVFGRGAAPWKMLGEDLSRVRSRLAGLARRPSGWAVGALGGVAAVRLLRGTASPPLGWDALTYHLYKAGRWVQLGDLAPQPAPDAWSYYEYFPVVGDVLWAWAMLPLSSDVLITAAGTLIWGALLLGTYAAARELEASPERAALAGGAVCAMPSVLPFLSSGYVDNTVAALFALGALFTIRAWRRRAPAEAPLAVGSLALMVGTKLTSAAFFALAAILVTVALLRSGASARVKRLALLGCLVAVIAGWPSYQRAWVEQGSPFHPFGIAFGEVVLSEGVEAANVLAHEFRSWQGFQLESRLEFWRHFLVGRGLSGRFLNPGLGAPLIVLLGLLGAGRAVRDPDRRTASLFLIGCAALMAAGFLSGNMESFRTTLKVTTAGRYVTIGFVAMAILGALWPGRLARTLWGIALAVGLLLSWPRGWAGAEVPALLAVGLVTAASLGGSLLALRWWRRSGRRILPALAVLLIVVAGLAALEAVHREHRYAIYEAAADPVDPAFHMHPLNRLSASAWPIWKALDDAEPHRLAATAGWDRLGHNWYRYPLLGSRLQNRVLYIPVTADGTIVDYRERDEVARRGSFVPWLERLVESRIDYVVSLAPRSTIEDHWMRQAPELFEPEIIHPRGFHAAYRLDRDAALALLRQVSGDRG